MKFRARMDIELSVWNVANEDEAREAILDWIANLSPANVHAGNFEIDLTEHVDPQPQPREYSNTLGVPRVKSCKPQVGDIVGPMDAEYAPRTRRALGKRQRVVTAVDDMGWLSFDDVEDKYPANDFFLSGRPKRAKTA